MNKTYCGYIAIIGRPNVGKSTLMNYFLGKKISIISQKPQTTRHKILGIKTSGAYQWVFVDTPGLHKNPKHTINKLMIKAALSVMGDVDVTVLVIDGRHWHKEDEIILKRLSKVNCPLIIALNKIDQQKNKDKLLPIIAAIQKQCEGHGIKPEAIIPISAKYGDGIHNLERVIKPLLPESPHLFPAGQTTDRNERFLVAELVREQIMRLFGEEVPHSVTVEIEKLYEERNILHVYALIWVERLGQKKIIVGASGEELKRVGKKARLEMEKAFGQKVFLQLWVKVKKGWTDDLRTLKNLGYGDF